MNIGINMPEDLDILDWDKMGRIFARSNFSHLRRIVLRLIVKPEVDAEDLRRQTKGWLNHKLPVCRDRDLFQVDVEPWSLVPRPTLVRYIAQT